jgi:hypothetical protein
MPLHRDRQSAIYLRKIRMRDLQVAALRMSNVGVQAHP